MTANVNTFIFLKTISPSEIDAENNRTIHFLNQNLKTKFFLY